MSFNLSKALAALAAIPALGQLTAQAVSAVEAAIPSTNVVGQKVAIVGEYIKGAAAAVATGVQEVESLIPVAINFAAQILQLVEAVKLGDASHLPTAPLPNAAPPPAHT